MSGTAMLYHPVHAPEGQPFYTDSDPLTSYADQGWVDDPSKIGVNPWGEDHKQAVAKRHLEYLSGEIPGISPGHGSDEGPAMRNLEHGGNRRVRAWPRRGFFEFAACGRQILHLQDG